jgi:hypothetical protein
LVQTSTPNITKIRSNFSEVHTDKRTNKMFPLCKGKKGKAIPVTGRGGQ